MSYIYEGENKTSLGVAEKRSSMV